MVSPLFKDLWLYKKDQVWELRTIVVTTMVIPVIFCSPNIDTSCICKTNMTFEGCSSISIAGILISQQHQKSLWANNSDSLFCCLLVPIHFINGIYIMPFSLITTDPVISIYFSDLIFMHPSHWNSMPVDNSHHSIFWEYLDHLTAFVKGMSFRSFQRTLIRDE